ncbi:Ribonuclease H-like superfamily protein [Rhynchospora pubera]|uniref:Ribonuclease H-like superfamily protein n=1 Tax=Rhynchospora pubera TaxID=906938 RepID=A0AAV8DU26_9POAL|nr:Ribonuclease H-like superfamily protein [Rhynchospora pubera]
MCLPKAYGGFGLINLKLQNISLLIRWIWWLYKQPASLWTCIAKQLYAKRDHNIPPLAWNAQGSFFWNDIFNLRLYFQLSTKSVVTSGSNTLLWYDNWGGNIFAFYGFENSMLPCKNITLKRARSRLYSLFASPLTAVQAEKLALVSLLPNSSTPDTLFWRWRTDATYSASSLYKCLVSAGKISFHFLMLWKVKVPPSIRHFLVFLAHGRIMTQDQLQKRHINFAPRCHMCREQILETQFHLFCDCTFAKAIWCMLNVDRTVYSSILSALSALCSHQQSLHGIYIAVTLWGLWIERNNRVFRNQRRNIQGVHNWIVHEATLFLKYC